MEEYAVRTLEREASLTDTTRFPISKSTQFVDTAHDRQKRNPKRRPKNDPYEPLLLDRRWPAVSTDNDRSKVLALKGECPCTLQEEDEETSAKKIHPFSG